MEDAAPDTQQQSLPDSKVVNDGQKRQQSSDGRSNKKKRWDNAKNVECLTVAPANFAETRRNLEVLAN